MKQPYLRGVVAVLLLLLLGVLPSAMPAVGQVCPIALTVRTPIINYPFASLPAGGGVSFGQVVDVNYSASFLNQNLTLERQDGAQWKVLQKFVGNQAGFTELGVGLDSGWAMFGENRIRVASASCTSGPASFVVRQDPTALVSDLGAYAFIALSGAFFFLGGRKLGWKTFAATATITYFVLAPWTGQRYDIYFLLSSGVRILQHLNPFDPGNPALYPGPLKWAYPPLYPLYSAFAFSTYQSLTGVPLPVVGALTWPGWLTATYEVYRAFVPPSLPILVLLLKVPMIASAVLTGLLLRKMTGDNSAVVRWCANPLVILVAAVWGQTDPIATLLAVASLYYFEKGREYHAYLFASLGAAVKVWPALVVPIFFVISARRSGLRAIKPLVAIAPVLVISLSVYGLYGNPFQSLFVFAYARGIPTFAGAFTVNGLTWQELLFVLKSPPVPLFLFVGLPLYAALLAWTYKSGETDAAKLLATFILIFYLTYNYVNPQYFYWILPLLFLQRRRLAAIAFTALPLVYLLFSYDIFYFVSPALLPDEFAFGASVLEQMKVSLFYQTPAEFLLITALVPTAIYLLFLRQELKAKGGTTNWNPPKDGGHLAE